MNRNNPRMLCLFCLMASAMLLMSVGSTSADDWRLRVGGVWLDPDGELDEVVAGDRVRSRSDEDVGVGITVERRLGERFGLELGLPMIADPELRVQVDAAEGRLDARDQLGVVALTAGFNLHLTPNHRADLYVGPFLGLVLLDDLEVTVAGEALHLSVDDELAVGAVLGVDLSVSERWGAYVAARYFAFDIEPSGESRVTVGFDTLALGVGVTIGF